MKRWISLILSVSVVLSLCVPMAMATPREERVDAWEAATNLTWSDDGDLIWESDYLSADPQDEFGVYFDGFKIALKYTTDDVGSVDEPIWNDVYYGWDTTYTRFPNIGDFQLPADGYYRFSVTPFGERYEENGYCTWYYGSASEWSPAKYFSLGDALPAPTDVKWEGTKLTWIMEDITKVTYFQIEPYYLATSTDSSGETYSYEKTIKSYWANPRSSSSGRYSLDLITDIGCREDNLIENGTQDYYFKIKAISGDTTKATDSAWVSSSNYMTVNADAPQLSVPTGLAWDGNTMTWTFVEGLSYDVQMYFQRTALTEEEELEMGQAGKDFVIEDPEESELFENITSPEDFPVLNNRTCEWGIGYYHFTVRARSQNLSENRSSVWSGPSPVKHRDGFDKLPVPTMPDWTENGEMTWTWDATPEQKSYLQEYRIQLNFRSADSNVSASCASYNVDVFSGTDSSWKRYASRDGYYSFTVRAMSEDEDAYRDGDISEISREFYFNAPDPLPSPTNLRWDGTTAVWDGLADETYVNRYQVLLYLVAGDGTETFERSISCPVKEKRYSFPANYLKEGKTYTFHVYAESKDPLLWSKGIEIGCQTTMTYVPATQKLPAPTGLAWDEETGRTAIWTIPTDTSNISGYEFEFFGDGNTYGVSLTVGEFYSINPNLANRLGDHITFRVRALSSNYLQYQDSDWAVCETYYIPPAGLDTPTCLAWDGNSMTWSWDGDADMFRYYRVMLYYAADETAEPELVTYIASGQQQYLVFNEWAERARQTGLYYFTVQAMSTDSDMVPDSEESIMSGPFAYTAPEALAPPTNLAWNGSIATWSASADEDEDQMDGYHLILKQYSPYEKEWINVRHFDPWECEYAISSEVFQLRGNGIYTFSVSTSSRNSLERIDSEEVMCQTSFTYTEPDVTLSAPTGLCWDNGSMKWENAEQENVAYYEIEVVGTETDRTRELIADVGSFPVLNRSILNACGSSVKFRVRAVSDNVNAASDSDWSAYSSVFTYDGESLQLPIPGNLTYDSDTSVVSWTPVAGAYKYRLELYYSETMDGTQRCIERRNLYDTECHIVTDQGLGYYTIKVMAYSDDSLFGDSDWATYTFQLSSIKQLDEPTELTWGVHRYENINHIVPGVVSWKRGFDQASYRVSIYRVVEDGEDVRVAGNSFAYGSGETSEYFFDNDFLRADRESGTYYFTVQALGDGEAFLDSAVARSENWEYIKPEEKLPAISGTKWIGNTMTWDMPEDASIFYGSQIELWYSATRYGEKTRISTMNSDQLMESEELRSYLINEHGDGCYWFKIRGISADITKYCAGSYSELCGPCVLGVESTEVNNILDSLTQDAPYMEKEDIINILLDELNGMDVDLADTMASDTTGSGTVAMISKLEDQFNVTTAVNVAQGTALGVTAADISFVGAVLNASEDAQNVTLNIGAPETNDEFEGYTNVVPFSMHLDGGADNDGTTENQQLVIPMQITMPVPTGLDPAYLILLHELPDDGLETIQPYVFEKDNQWYASFIVTSFSDFAFANAELKAQKVSAGVNVTVNLAVDVPGSAICAVYDRNGRQLGVSVIPTMGAGFQTIPVPCDNSHADTVKLFLLDKGSAPLFAEAKLEDVS